MRRTCFFVLVAVLVSAASLQAGGEFVVSPAVRAQATYDTNVLFEDSEDIETLFTPSVGVQYRQEKSSLSLNAALDIYRYVDNTLFNRINHRYSAGYGRSFTPRLSGNISGSVQISTEIETELEENNIISGDESTSRTYGAGAGINYILSPKDSISFSTSYSTRDNDNEESTDRDNYSFGIGWDRALTQRTALNFNTSVAVSKTETVNDDITTIREVEISGIPTLAVVTGDEITEGTQTSYTGTLGISHRLTERTSFSFSAGPRYSVSSFSNSFESNVPLAPNVNILDIDTDDNTLGYVFSGSANYVGERYNTGLTLSRTFTSTNQGENVNRNNIGLSFSYRLTEFITSNSNVFYSKLKSDDVVDESEQNSIRFSQRLSWRFIEDASAFAQYSYTGTRNEVTDEFSNRSRYVVGLSWNLPEYRD